MLTVTPSQPAPLPYFELAPSRLIMALDPRLKQFGVGSQYPAARAIASQSLKLPKHSMLEPRAGTK